MNAKEVAKKYNEILADKEFMNSLYNESYSFDDSLCLLSGIMEAIIGANGYKYKKLIRTPFELSRYFYSLGLNNKQITENIMTNPILCHAFNGVNLKRVLKYGLGSEQIIDKNIAQKLNEVEQHFGSMHNYYHFQLNSRNEIYSGFPGFAEMEFATKYSPERLFLGILHQKENESLPMIMGESKKGYYTRVIDHKIDNMVVNADKDMLKTLAHEIVKKFCSKRPIIALFDAYSDDYKLVVHDFMKCSDVPIEKYLKNNLRFYALSNPVDVFSRSSCGHNIFDVDDMAICDNIISSKSIGFVEVPDGYELKQYLAHVQGAKWGDRIDFTTGKRVNEKGTPIGDSSNCKAFRDEKVDVVGYFKKSKLVESDFNRLIKKEELKNKLTSEKNNNAKTEKELKLFALHNSNRKDINKPIAIRNVKKEPIVNAQTKLIDVNDLNLTL